MIKIVGLIRKRDDMTFEEFVRHWQDKHALLIASMPGVRGYVQNPAHQRPDKDWPFDGMAEVWFDDVASVKLAYESEAGQLVNEDHDNFVQSLEWFLVDEHPVVRLGRDWSGLAEEAS